MRWSAGGGTGIGRATAGMLAGEGYDVIIVGRRPDVLADAVKWIGPQATAVRADLAEPGQADAVVEAVARPRGGRRDQQRGRVHRR
nr:hypothetical protein GCM10020092_100660 [Actinoplanes digitatis]